MAENATKTKNNPLAYQTPEDIVRNRAQAQVVRRNSSTVRSYLEELAAEEWRLFKEDEDYNHQMLHCSTLWLAFHGLKTKMAS